MFGVTRPWYRDRVEAGGSPQRPGSVKADQKRGAPPAASTQPERSPGLDSPHQRSRVMDKPPTFVGVDVSKHRLDVHLRPSGEGFTISHDEAGVAGPGGSPGPPPPPPGPGDPPPPGGIFPWIHPVPSAWPQ